MFPESSHWNQPVEDLPVLRGSDRMVRAIGADDTMHADFGSGRYAGARIGIPFVTVGRSQPKVPVAFDYDDEADQGPYPIPRDVPVEGGRGSDGDRHVIVVDRDRCRLYELFAAYPRDGGSRWTAGSGAIWNLRSNRMRPAGWTSADAAGLPILPGLLRWNEVRSGKVNHAIRFTTDVTRTHHLWPARHDAGSRDGAAYPPMGARFRLRASFSTQGYGPDARAVIRAMKLYGLVLADNGSPWFFQGERNAHWPNRLISELKTIPASSFVAVDASGLKVSGDSAQVR
jgi:hypothetical protein